MGPLLLAQAGIHCVECLEADLFDLLEDGDGVELRGGEIHCRGGLVAAGEVLEPGDVLARTEELRDQIGDALEAFARNTVEHMVEESELLSGKLELPRFQTDFRDRHALIVVRGVDHRRDLRALRPYVRDVRPAIVAVDGGADAVRAEGFSVDMIVGDMDSVTDETLRCGAEILVHAYREGHAPGEERLRRLGVPFQTVAAPGISEDIAMLLAHEKGAELIVAVGTHFNLIEFLERDRAGMSSTFVTRLKVGEILVDAKGLSRLFSRQVGLWPLVLFAVAGLLAVVVAIVVSPALRHLIELIGIELRGLVS
jgi:uncharacterized membrane-anchored protein